MPSEYAKAAKSAGLDLIGWSLERDGPLNKGGGFYHSTVKAAIDRDGGDYSFDFYMETMHVSLARGTHRIQRLGV